MPFVKKVKRRKNIQGICAAARRLRRSRQHLYEVLRGRRRSPVLLARYLALKKEGP